MRGDTSLAAAPHGGTLHASADALADGSTTAVALCEALLDRSAAVDETIKGFLSLDHDAILADAAASDDRRASGTSLGRLDGLPIAIKDNINVSGQQCSCASKLLAPYTSLYDATVTSKLKAAGMICAGRANMDEFAMGSSTENSAFGRSANPWDPGRVPGGSSGGSAAVVASGQMLAALGSDTGGSIRQPAGFCGIVGLKPTYGRVSRFGLVAFASSLDQIGPLTTDVRDAALLLDLIGGHDPSDSTSLPEPCGGFEAALDEVDPAGLTIGVPREYFDVSGLSDDVRQATEQVIDRYRSAGSTIVEVSMPNTEYAVATYYVIATAEASSNLARFDGIRYGDRATDGDPDLIDTYFQTRENGFGREVKRRIILGTYVLSGGYYDAFYLRAQKVRTLIRRDFAEAFKQCDVLISPVAPTTAFPAGEVTDPLEMYLSDIYTIPVNLAGNCAISLKAGSDSDGMPIGVQLIGAALNERTLLQAAHWLEGSI
jgi:aspartyl-tRNA(Asn)/glutamyl-tRNA(Gln) amidotransferase subunit A